MKYREILSYDTGKEEVVGRVEQDAEEDACRIVTDYPALKESLERGIVGAGGFDPTIGWIKPEDGEVYLNSLEFEFMSGLMRVSEIKGEYGKE